MNYHAISQDSDRTTLELRRDLIVEAQFNNSPVQPHSDELYQIDPTRLSDSRLKKLLDSAANLINQFSDQFYSGNQATATHDDFISRKNDNSLIKHSCTVMITHECNEKFIKIISHVIHLFFSIAIQESEDLFNREIDYQLSDIQFDHVKIFADEFIAKNGGSVINDPFVINFPQLLPSHQIAVQGRFQRAPDVERHVRSYDGLAEADGAQISKKIAFLRLLEDEDVSGKFLTFVSDLDEIIARICTISGEASKILHIRARQTEDGRGRTHWYLEGIKEVKDNEDFTLK